MVEMKLVMVEMKPVMVEMKSDMVEMKPVMVEMKSAMVEMKSDMVEMKSDSFDMTVEMKKFHFGFVLFGAFLNSDPSGLFVLGGASGAHVFYFLIF